MFAGLRVILNFGGASDDEKGVAGAGYVIRETEGGPIVYQDSIALGKKFQSEAAYEAFIRGVARVYREGYTLATIRGDSALVCRQVSGTSKIESEIFKRYHLRAVAEVAKIRSKIELVSRGDNKDAHSLADKAVTAKRESAHPPPPRTPGKSRNIGYYAQNSDSGRLKTAFGKWENNGRPILVYGETQTGKKIAIRTFLKERGYSVCENATAIREHEAKTTNRGGKKKKKPIEMRQTTLVAKLSYLIHEQDIAWSKTWKSIHQPIFMASIDPYKHLKKAELERKFNLVRWAAKNRNVGTRDVSLNYWDATRALCRRDLSLPQKADACTLANPYLSTVIHNSYLKAASSVDDCARIADMYSQADLFISLGGEYTDILTKIGPASISNVARTQLQIASARPAAKKRKRSKIQRIMDRMTPRTKAQRYPESQGE